MNKPSWAEAPEWAVFLAQDEDGWWSWWDRKPVVCEIAKCWNQGAPVSDFKYQDIHVGPVLGNWAESLEARPPMTDAAGKPCPLCGAPMSNLTSQYVRLCTNGKCGHTVAWNLNPGQKPLYGSNRA